MGQTGWYHFGASTRAPTVRLPYVALGWPQAFCPDV